MPLAHLARLARTSLDAASLNEIFHMRRFYLTAIHPKKKAHNECVRHFRFRGNVELYWSVPVYLIFAAPAACHLGA